MHVPKFREWGERYFGPDYFRLGPSYKPNHARDKKEVNDVLCLAAQHGMPKRRPLRILDLGCGYGRHAIELARAGHEVVGADASKYLLGIARKNAAKIKRKITFLERDFRDLGFKDHFDLELCLFTSFGYLENDRENEKVIQAASEALKKDGVFILDVVNFDPATLKPHRETIDEKAKVKFVEDANYDKRTKRLNATRRTIGLSGGVLAAGNFSLRIYTVDEIKQIFGKHNFEIVSVYGDLSGNEFSVKSPRMVIVAKKI